VTGERDAWTRIAAGTALRASLHASEIGVEPEPRHDHRAAVTVVTWMADVLKVRVGVEVGVAVGVLVGVGVSVGVRVGVDVTVGVDVGVVVGVGVWSTQRSPLSQMPPKTAMQPPQDPL